MNILTRVSAIDVGYVDYTSNVSNWCTVYRDGRVTYKMRHYGEEVELPIPQRVLQSDAHLSALVAYVFDNGLLPRTAECYSRLT